MFPGFKTPVYGLKQTNAGNSLFMPFGTAAGRFTDSKNSTNTNNVILGSGINVGTDADQNNIYVGVTDCYAAGTPLKNNVTINGSKNILIISGNSGSNFGTGGVSLPPLAWAAPTLPYIVIGTLTSITRPGDGSTTIGSYTQGSGPNSVCIGAYSYVATSATNSVGIGYAITVTGANTFCAATGGGSNSAANSAMFGMTTANSVNPSVFQYAGLDTNTGSNQNTEHAGEISFQTQSMSASAQVKVSLVPLWAVTTSATPVEMNVGGGTTTTTATALYLKCANGATYIHTMDIVAQDTATLANVMAFTAQFCVQRGANAAATSIIGTPTITTIANPSSLSWSVAVTADTSNGRPAIKVTGGALTIRWVATSKVTKVATT